MKEHWIAAYEELVSEYLEEHPDADQFDKEVEEWACKRADDRMVDNWASKIDDARDRMKYKDFKIK